ncbi:MAG: Glutamate/gamma-aminobutyrate antiporter [Chlamydiae bacterium]|nr:Glutamate/gamma-aminobutyrate antiporter [Chlamydiota bacterium]
MSKKVVKIPRSLGLFTLAMINVAAVGNVRNWPFISEYGFASLFYLILAAVVFFFPVSLVSAELATAWPERGGVYAWVKEAFGHRMGFLAAWLQWIENIGWYPAVLSFISGTIAYALAPHLAENTLYTLGMVLALFWLATFANFFGMQASGWLSKMGAFCGLLIPGAIIITLGAMWIIGGNPLQIAFTWDSFIPEFSIDHMVLFTGVLLAFGGMEMSANHAREVENPQRDFPRAIFFSAALILALTILGVLAVAIVIPQKEISLVAGAMQALAVFFNKYGMTKFLPWIAILITLGTFGAVATWIIGPSKALLAAAEGGDLPKAFTKSNRHGAPVGMLLFQGVLVTIISLLFLLMPTVSSAFWVLNVVAAQLYLLMYILMFIAAIRLRYKRPNQKRLYSVPGGNMGMWIVSGLGIVGSAFALIVGYFPPAQIAVGSQSFYTGFLVVCTLLGCSAPFILAAVTKAVKSKGPGKRQS